MNYSQNVSLENNTCHEAIEWNKVEPLKAWILVVIGGAAVILNTMIIACIASDTALRTKRFVWLILNQCASDFWNGCLIMIVYGVENGRSRSVCYNFSWWRHQTEIFSALLALCAGNSPVTGEIPSQGPVTRSFEVFFDQRLNQRFSKQSWGRGFETHCSHYDVIVMLYRDSSRELADHFCHLFWSVRMNLNLLYPKKLARKHNYFKSSHCVRLWPLMLFVLDIWGHFYQQG